MINLGQYRLRPPLLSAVITTIERYIKENKSNKDLISQSQANKLFGEGTIKRWEEENQLTIKRGRVSKKNPKMYSKSEMERIFSAETLCMQNIRIDDI